MRIDFVTIFPRMFDPLLAEGVIARGVKQGLIDVRVWDLREFATDKHRSTDDEAYGGGPGMVMLAEPVLRAADEVRGSRFEGRGQRSRETSTATSSLEPRTSKLEPHIVMTSPKGRTFNQNVAHELFTKKWVVFLCGRYEGFDERIREILEPDEISIGDFVVSGGELPAMLMADAVGRLVEGVVGNADSVVADSFYDGILDYPHYTRPEELRGRRVPEILLSGHHENIRKWRKEQALRETLAKRPDLLETADLDEEAREILKRIENES
ncbi:MAG TPA: tRNA (guanosine(37)-N1)-methyltransferase TrmD [Thermoanaerobaculia bacterium]|nr:tRNA (guanosine(37)-N1)-methyltransferase TrmD [Thermoanaerobaculia bacterium]